MTFEEGPSVRVSTVFALCQCASMRQQLLWEVTLPTHMLRFKWGQGTVGSCQLDVLEVSAFVPPLHHARWIPFSVEGLSSTSQELNRIMEEYSPFFECPLWKLVPTGYKDESTRFLLPRSLQPSERNWKGLFTRNVRHSMLAYPQIFPVQYSYRSQCLEGFMSLKLKPEGFQKSPSSSPKAGRGSAENWEIWSPHRVSGCKTLFLLLCSENYNNGPGI